ncbi:MAG: hypothetical protein LBQ67_04390 [Treponema sp.]|jgi:hypothetical protein|nr:hypothetical protein [Treponema sp.]
MMKKMMVSGALLSLVFVSCTDFFTTSWGRWAARDPANLIPKVTAGNVQELIEMAENNPDLSLEVLKGIGKSVGGASGKDKTDLQNAAITAALNASDLTNALMNSGSNMSSMEDPAKVKDSMLNTLNGLGNLTPAADNLAAILPGPADGAAFDAFAATASADDLAMAAALIMAGEAKKSGDPNGYVSGYIRGSSPLAEALAAKAAEKYADGSGDNSVLKDLLDELGLTPAPAPQP